MRIDLVDIIAIAIAALGSTAISPFGVDLRRGALALLERPSVRASRRSTCSVAAVSAAGARIITLALIARAPRLFAWLRRKLTHHLAWRRAGLLLHMRRRWTAIAVPAPRRALTAAPLGAQRRATDPPMAPAPMTSAASAVPPSVRNTQRRHSVDGHCVAGNDACSTEFANSGCSTAASFLSTQLEPPPSMWLCAKTETADNQTGAAQIDRKRRSTACSHLIVHSGG